MWIIKIHGVVIDEGVEVEAATFLYWVSLIHLPRAGNSSGSRSTKSVSSRCVGREKAGLYHIAHRAENFPKGPVLIFCRDIPICGIDQPITFPLRSCREMDSPSSLHTPTGIQSTRISYQSGIIKIIVDKA